MGEKHKAEAARPRRCTRPGTTPPTKPLKTPNPKFHINSPKEVVDRELTSTKSYCARPALMSASRSRAFAMPLATATRTAREATQQKHAWSGCGIYECTRGTNTFHMMFAFHLFAMPLATATRTAHVRRHSSDTHVRVAGSTKTREKQAYLETLRSGLRLRDAGRDFLQRRCSPSPLTSAALRSRNLLDS
jgi:hypothetical protein